MGRIDSLIWCDNLRVVNRGCYWKGIFCILVREGVLYFVYECDLWICWDNEIVDCLWCFSLSDIWCIIVEWLFVFGICVIK